jgi:hypothetical protein
MLDGPKGRYEWARKISPILGFDTRTFQVLKSGRVGDQIPTLQTGRSQVRFPMASLEYFSDIILPVALWPWGLLSLYQKWVPVVFSGGKGGRCVRLTTLPPSCAVVMKSGNLKFLEPSGPLQTFNGTDLPYIYIYVYIYIIYPLADTL